MAECAMSDLSAPKEAEKPEREWKDITSEFFGSIGDLDVGELLHYELFGLFEAMSAIEMMDKKMDIGMMEEKEKNTPLTFELAVQVRNLDFSLNFSS